MENLEVKAQKAQEVAVAEQTATKATEKTTGAKAFFVKIGKNIREFFRKFMVSLKRRPHNIALFVLIISFVVYSFSLTDISNTTAYIGREAMGLCEFAIMLFSILSIVCFLNAFPKRGKVKILFMIILYVMLAVVIACDIIYFIRIVQATTGSAATIKLDTAHLYVLSVKYLSIAHAVLMLLSAVLTATIPLYGKLFKKIKTSIEVEYTEADEAVELADEE